MFPFTECACGAALTTVATQMRGTCDECDAAILEEAAEVCAQISQSLGWQLIVADVWRTGDRLAHGTACQCVACAALR